MDTATLFDTVSRCYIRADEHWGSDLDVLKSAFNSMIEKRKNPRYLDVGCGPGFHLEALKRLYPEAAITGIDASKKMVAEARRRLQRLRLKGQLVQTDVLNLAAKCDSYDVVSFLNNGLGNVYRSEEIVSTDRVEIVSKMRTLLRHGGYVVMSVYNLNKFDRDYGKRLRVLDSSNIAHGDMYVEYRPQHGSPLVYFSHWFKPDEVAHLLERGGFRVELLEERMSRIVVKARAI